MNSVHEAARQKDASATFYGRSVSSEEDVFVLVQSGLMFELYFQIDKTPMYLDVLINL